jgi:hypothetical protein
MPAPRGSFYVHNDMFHLNYGSVKDIQKMVLKKIVQGFMLSDEYGMIMSVPQLSN